MSVLGYIYSMMKRLKVRLRRNKALKHVYDYPPTSDNWVKNMNPILGSEKSGSYFDPYVLNDSNDTYMYISRRKDNSIVRFTLDKEFQLCNEIQVLVGQPETWEDMINRADVVLIDSKYYMWYTGQYKGKSCIGFATSEDGVAFVKYKNNPILVPETEVERDSVMNPCILYDTDAQIFRMWYAAGETYEPDVICYATSFDGIHWKKSERNPVLQKGMYDYDKYKVGGCDVQYKEGLYTMYYIGYHDVDTARICCATSKNGIDWERSKANPIISPSPNNWDGHAVYKPSYILDGNSEYLFYNGRKENLEKIGYAVRNT